MEGRQRERVGGRQLKEYSTKDYDLFVGRVRATADSDYLSVYQVYNRTTAVTEYECTFFYEALAYVQGLQEKYDEAVDAFTMDRIEAPEVH